MLRVIFLLLLAVNLFFLAWQAWLLPETEPETVLVTPPADRGLQLAELETVTERESPVESDSVPEVVAPSRPSAFDPAGCLALGPFGERGDLEDHALSLDITAPHVHERALTEIAAWWVILPPEAVDDPAAMARRLEEAGAGDYFVITSGDAVGGVSLGLFSAPERATQRQQQIAGLGFDPQIRERERESTTYWLLVPLGLTMDLPVDGELRLEPSLCPDDNEWLVTREGEPLE
ncbi:hypothetical protein [Natronospira bacteriovora]|uniref:Sporulation related protein n=1 Tax=Natronospira bacteriovora TaxID=3069753 RepID=A0ABU0WAR8_9GAMM|nr:hypothetical protein [Natronospira sp. AB-CW4]MDQ2070555.1 hypothetical protein [Natronospira sp. AB-CW4]